jgi:uncharacterized membrane protein
MAGIGFELKKILRQESFSGDFGAYLYSALISSGPWLMSIICLAVLGVVHRMGHDHISHELFRSTITYSYAFSLIFVGILQHVTTRYLADIYYEKKNNKTLSAFLTGMLMLLISGSMFAGICYFFFQISIIHKILAVCLFLMISLIWFCMIFLSAIKDYANISYAYIWGSLFSIIFTIITGKYMGIEGAIWGYLSGQSIIFFWLLAIALKEFPETNLINTDYLLYFKKFWDLALIGFIFNLAIWIDKFIFWHAMDGRTVVPYFFTHDLYEAPLFFSYITVIPSLSFFLLKMETTFSDHYWAYYAKVTDRMNYDSILEEKNLMIITLKESIRGLLIIQGLITTICLIYSPELVKLLHLQKIQIPILRISIIGSFLNILLSINIIILFYFDLRGSVLCISIIFLLLNTSFSYLSALYRNIQFYGYGYTYASFISLLLGMYLLDTKLNDLEYITFAKQPVIEG